MNENGKSILVFFGLRHSIFITIIRVVVVAAAAAFALHKCILLQLANGRKEPIFHFSY